MDKLIDINKLIDIKPVMVLLCHISVFARAFIDYSCNSQYIIVYR